MMPKPKKASQKTAKKTKSDRGSYHGDEYFSRKARQAGFVARSAFKLEAIDKKFSLLCRGQRVLDLGCAPGSWSQYAASKVGAGGGVWGIDLKPVEQVSGPGHMHFWVGDVYAMPDEVCAAGPFDVVLSDMAPATMGNAKVDACRSLGLGEMAQEIARMHLVEGGALAIKILEGGGLSAFVADLRKSFQKVSRLRPEATRSNSTEIFIVAQGYQGQADDAETVVLPGS